MTYFAKAYFKESFSKSSTFVQIFNKAVEYVEKWELDDNVEEHSEPQIYIGKEIASHLALWRSQ